jgi:hypothetical protein
MKYGACSTDLCTVFNFFAPGSLLGRTCIRTFSEQKDRIEAIDLDLEMLIRYIANPKDRNFISWFLTALIVKRSAVPFNLTFYSES